MISGFNLLGRNDFFIIFLVMVMCSRIGSIIIVLFRIVFVVVIIVVCGLVKFIWIFRIIIIIMIVGRVFRYVRIS